MSEKKRVVVLGGGTGQATMLRGLKNIENISLTTIVTVADDGGSTGRLRRSYHIPAMGDLRNVMIALAESESVLSGLMNYRFEDMDETCELNGHNLGNLILTALTQTSGSFMEAIAQISKVLNVKGDILPCTCQIITLFAEMEDGTIVRGESNIPKLRNRIRRVFYEEEVHATRQALEAIEEADYILYGIGSIYTSILPNLIINEISAAIRKSKAIKIYFCNAMTQPGETAGYSMEEHVEAIKTHGENPVDIVVFAHDDIPQEVIDRYEDTDAQRVVMRDEEHDFLIVSTELLRFDGGLVRHDSAKIQSVMEYLLQSEATKCLLPPM
jgi:uncharacterized cofD-like protein